MATELELFGVSWWQVGPAMDGPVDTVTEWIRQGPPDA